jgi:phosphopantothenoylcysteine decarboxylase/phosphopantothenate--cysteine ligase
MWDHPATRENLRVLAERGVVVVPPEEGRLAGGDVGQGRLADPATIIATMLELFDGGLLRGRSVLVTAGGTREPIDPVRYIGNRSSGKQGHAIAQAAKRMGAEVTLVTTVDLPGPAGAKRIDVSTAAEMHDVVTSQAEEHDIVIMAAAVADFRPIHVAEGKIKKADGVPEIVLEPTIDILAALGRSKRSDQVLVGFAAETSDLRSNAAAKLTGKGADLIVANDVSIPGVGFAHDTNEVTILGADGSVVEIPLTEKASIAEAVLSAAAERLPETESQTR